MVTNHLISDFFQKIIDPECPSFHFINGTYGVGKTYLMEKTLDELEKSNFPYVALVFRLEKLRHFSDLSDFLTIQTNLNQSLGKMVIDEVSFFKNNYNNLLNNLSIRDDVSGLKEVITEFYLCFDYFHTDYLFQNYPSIELEKRTKEISSLFEKNIDKRVLLYFFEVQAESLLAPILNFVLQNKENVSKPFVFFFFDDYETSAGTIDWWIFNTLAPFLNKTLNDFIAYKLNDEGIKVCSLINLKFILFSRYTFFIKKFQKIYPHLKYSVTTIQPFSKDHIISFNLDNTLFTLFQPDEIVSKTYGIYFNLMVLSELHSSLDPDNLKEKYHKKIWEKISVRISLPLLDFIKFSSDLTMFSEEFVRFSFTNYYDYARLFQYFLDEEEIFQILHSENQTITMKATYSEIIKDVFHDTSFDSQEVRLIKMKFQNFYNNYGNLPLRARKMLRSLAYFDQFDFGYVIQKVFADDFDSVKLFVLNHPKFFDREDSIIFRLKENHRNFLSEINSLVDGERFKQKRIFLEKTIQDFSSFANNEVVRLRNELETLLKGIFDSENEMEKLKKEKELLLSKILSKQNDLNLLRDKYSKIGKKVPAVIFILLVISSILLYLLGNNLSYFFNDNLQNDFIGGLGIALKFIGITLFGAFVYLIINFLTSRTRTHHFNHLKNEINIIEQEYESLKNKLSNLKFDINVLSDSIEQKNKQKQEIQKKISEYVRAQQICYISATK